MSKILALRLEGPLQAWGDSSKFSHRNTLQFPTRSGVMGLVLSCMGVSRAESSAELKNWQATEFKVWQPFKQNARKGVLKPTLLRDFQTIKNVPKAGGGIKKTEISERDYLEDAIFIILIKGPEKLLTKAKEGLINPTWEPFLGRKGCVPSEPIFFGLFDAEEEILEELKKEENLSVDAENILKTSEDGDLPFNDFPLDFLKRTYSKRYLRVT